TFCTYNSPESLAGLTVDINGVEFNISDEAGDRFADLAASRGEQMSKAEIQSKISESEAQLNTEITRMNESKFGLVFTIGQIGVLVLMALIVVMIFRFKNRRKQLRMGRMLFLIYLLVFVGILLGGSYGFNVMMCQFSDRIGETMMAKLDEFEIIYNVATYLPAVAAAFIFLANVRIKSDERLVKSLDRLR